MYNSAGRFRNIKVTAPDGKILWEGPPDLPTTKTDNSTSTILDALQSGTVLVGERSYRKGAWAGSRVPYEVHIRERTGNTFLGHKFDNGPGRNRVELQGEIRNGEILWTEKNARETVKIQGVVKDGQIQVGFTGSLFNGIVIEGDGKLKYR